MKSRLSNLFYFLGCVLAVWVFLTHQGIPDYLLPTPQQVAVALIQQPALLLSQTAITFSEMGLALLLGVGGGVVVAVAMTSHAWIRRLLYPLVMASQVIPVFTLAPLLVLWLGFGIGSKVVVAALILFFPVCLTLFDGLCRVPQQWLDLAITLQASPWRCFWQVRWPAALPFFFSGLQMAAVLAPIGVVLGEWVGASQGLGYLMMQSTARMETATSFAALLCLMLLAVILSGVVQGLRRYFLWPNS
ncbi:ABC transporter permease [Tatumella ptyseos]|uniref:ABC transporter permease n=1 Tax=Tatumella ptyseos TaxID=82987 RepID=UPI0026F06006|nr:ABC transporter permease [Tatumella ptyseos]WKX26401.1 ABC transporter permease [Tatumella ptyseos]